MTGISELLQYGTVGALSALALVSLLRWSRNTTEEAGRWAALAFASLAVVTIESAITSAAHDPPAWIEKAGIAIVVLFPYFLYRFATSFSATIRWAGQSAVAVTGAVMVVSLLLPEIPAEGEPRPGWVAAFILALLLQWSALSAVAVFRLWRGGRGQPALARRRMRTMSLAAIGLNLAILASALIPSDPVGMLVQLLAAASAMGFYVGFAPPQFLRVVWRQPEQDKLHRGIQELMGATTTDEVAGALLPHVAGIVGGYGAAIVEGDGRGVARFRPSAAPSEEKGDETVGDYVVQRIPLGDGELALQVWTSPYTPYFGPEEFELLKNLGSLAELSLDRSKLFEGEREARSALERANKELERANDELQKEIAERKRAEAELEAASAEAERANVAKSEFLSRMSHELRTPLNSILGFGQLLEDSAIDDDQTDGVHYILKAGRHLLDLINEVLDISRIEAGTMTLSLEPVRPGEVVREVVDLMRPVASREEISLIAELPDGLRTHIMADTQRLKQVLLNLIVNAVKYNRDEGSVSIVLRAGADHRVRIEVCDTGLGIRPDRMDKLFVPFDRLGAETSRVEGTGLGLSLSKRLIELMGGEIGVESVVDQGSTFWVEFAAVEAPGHSSGDGEISQSSTDDFAAAHAVLYIEDNLSNLTLIERILARRPDVKLITAMQAKIGLELARSHRPDLILLDVHLPDMRGEDALRRLRGHPATRDIPVVVVSADATQGQITRLLDAGASEYLTKPLDVTRFLGVLDKALSVGAKDPV